MAEYYIDPTAGSNGSGAEGSPFNSLENAISATLAAFNAASEDYIYHCLAGADPAGDQALLSINSTSNTPRVMRFIATGANRHTGVRGTGFRFNQRFRVNTSNVNVTVELVGLNVREVYQDNGNAAVTNVLGCLIPGSTGHAVFCGGGIINVVNSAVVGGAWSGPLAENNNGSGVINCINTTIANCGSDGGLVARFGGTATAINCYSGGNAGADFSGVTSPTNCRSEDGSQSTTTAAYSTANFTSVTAGSENLKLVSGSALIDAGVGPGSNGNVPTEDFEGDARSGATTDVGFDQVPGGPPFAGTASDVASASATLSTQIRMGAAAASVASSSAAITTAIRLAAAAISRAAAAGTLNTGALLQASASNVVAAVAELTTSVRLGAIAAGAATASGALINWATVTLAGDLYQGPGGVLDPNFWLDDVPVLGTTIYYDPSHITIYPNGEISSDSNECTAVVTFLGPNGWALGVLVVTDGLVAYARDSANASAQLTTAIGLAAAANALATATAAFSIGAGLTAEATDVASASGSLTTGVPLSALAEGVSAAVAELVTSIQLQAAALDSATATANLNGVISLNAAATAIAASLGSLTTQVRLGASASGTVTAAGSLSTGVRLTAAAEGVAAAGGALFTAIRIGGSANSLAAASASLSTHNPLLAAAINVATAVATLSTGISLSANALAIAHASGTLVNSIDLLAEAKGEARATAVLTDVIETPPIGVYPSDPRYVVTKSRWSPCGQTPRFACKDSVERVVLTFDLSGVLLADESLDGPITFTIAASAGSDANAAAIFSGYPAYDMTKRKILLPVKDGVPGCVYYVKVSAATSNQYKVLALAGLLSITG